MNTLFVLIMIFGGYGIQSGQAILTQEFTSLERCEDARIQLAKVHSNSAPLRFQGCFPK